MRYVLFVSILATFAGAAYAESLKAAHSGRVAANNKACIPCTENVKLCGDPPLYRQHCIEMFGNKKVRKGEKCGDWYNFCE